MEPLQRPNAENKLDIAEILGILLRRFWIIVFSGVLVGVCALIYTKMTTTAVYTSSTKIYILEKSENSKGVTGSDLQFGATLASDYVQLIKDRTVMEGVIAELGLSTTPEALASRVSVNMPDSGRIITISVSDGDPYMASKLTSEIRDKAALHIKDVMDSEAVNIVEEANIPRGQTLANYKKNGMTGVVLGMALAISIIVLLYMMNDTINKPEDVERYLGLSVLGSIPLMQEEKKTRTKKEKKDAGE